MYFFLLVVTYTKHGERCKDPCGSKGLYKGEKWCKPISAPGSKYWDYCTENLKGICVISVCLKT